MLRYSDDSRPGISRRRIGRAWGYFAADGGRITDRDEIDRLNAIALPPAYQNAWFCPDPQGHIQATGTDARGRKQYRYHADFRARQDNDKYGRCAEFGAALPRLRRRVAADLARRGLGRETVLAAVVRLLDSEYIRVGNEQYAKENKSFGATTLRSRHVRRERGGLRMRFAGKHGITREVAITDRNLARIVRRCNDLPGQNLFQYLGPDGEPHAITSADVNDYIRSATGTDFTAKNFRTWGASVIAFETLLKAAAAGERIGLKAMLEPVAEALGNTPAISRKSYVHPRLIEAVRDFPDDPLGGMERPRARRGLSSAETGLLQFLARRRRPRRRASPPAPVENGQADRSRKAAA